MNQTAPDMTVDWEPVRSSETREMSVKLTDAPDITVGGRPCRPVKVKFLFVRRNIGPWERQVTIYADVPGSVVRTFFSPDDVYRMPQWLADIIASATPTED